VEGIRRNQASEKKPGSRRRCALYRPNLEARQLGEQRDDAEENADLAQSDAFVGAFAQGSTRPRADICSTADDARLPACCR
jgi:hypothetical protein